MNTSTLLETPMNPTPYDRIEIHLTPDYGADDPDTEAYRLDLLASETDLVVRVTGSLSAYRAAAKSDQPSIWDKLLEPDGVLHRMLALRGVVAPGTAE